MAYYQVDMAYLYVMPDVAESEDFSMLRRGESIWSLSLFSVRILNHMKYPTLQCWYKWNHQ